MSATPRFSAPSVVLVVVIATATPQLIRSALRGLISGPITGAHVLLAQGSLLLLVGLVARGGSRAVGRAPAPWSQWVRDAAHFAGAMALVLFGRVVSGHHEGAVVSLQPVTLIVTAPIVEEIVYRGFLPLLLSGDVTSANGATKRVGIAIASSAAFAAAHLGGEGFAEAEFGRFLVSFGCGLAFHALRDASGGLAAPMAVHAGVNAMSLRAMG